MLRIRTFLISIIVVAHFGAFSAAPVKNLPERRRYTDPQGRFSFEFRGEWRAANIADKPDVVGWYLISGTEGDKKVVKAQVIVTRVQLENNLTFEEYLELEDMRLKELPNLSLKGKKEIRYVDGHSTVRRMMSFTENDPRGNPITKLAGQYYIKRPESVWGITLLTFPRYQQMLFEVENTMLKSFRFLSIGEALPENEIAALPLPSEPIEAETKLSKEESDESLIALQQVEPEKTSQDVEEVAALEKPEFKEHPVPAISSETIPEDRDIPTEEAPLVFEERIEELLTTTLIEEQLMQPIWSPKIGNIPE